MKINNKKIGPNQPVFIIAEAGVNYNNDLALAFEMVDVAKKANADAIKFQTFIAEEIQLPDSKKPKYQKKIKGKNYFNIIKDLEPDFLSQRKIYNYCKKKNILFLSTPYDRPSVDFLDKLGVSAFKISSSDVTNHLFLEYVAKKKKPILLSTGMSTLKDINSAFRLFKKLKMQNKLSILHATSDYPTNDEELNLNIIKEFIKKYGIPIGFSDHSPDYIASLGAIAFGACIVEKHFTLDRKLPGPDHSSSLEPVELTEWIRNIRKLEKSFGSSIKRITKSEKHNLTMRKILVLKPAKQNTKVTIDMLDTKRGNTQGVLPLTENIQKILGKKLKKDLKSPTQFSWYMLK